MTEALEFDPNSLTLQEMCDLEEATGENAYSSLAGGVPSAKTLAGLVWIVKRRTDPGFSFDDAKKLKVSDLDFQVAE